MQHGAPPTDLLDALHQLNRDPPNGDPVIAELAALLRSARDAPRVRRVTARGLVRMIETYADTETVDLAVDQAQLDPGSDLLAKLEQIEERVDRMTTNLELVKANVGDEWGERFPDRPRANCACASCPCRLHVFPGSEAEICAWCRQGDHDDRPRRSELSEAFDTVTATAAYERAALKVETGRQTEDGDLFLNRRDVALLLDAIDEHAPEIASHVEGSP